MALPDHLKSIFDYYHELKFNILKQEDEEKLSNICNDADSKKLHLLLEYNEGFSKDFNNIITYYQDDIDKSEIDKSKINKLFERKKVIDYEKSLTKNNQYIKEMNKLESIYLPNTYKYANIYLSFLENVLMDNINYSINNINASLDDENLLSLKYKQMYLHDDLKLIFSFTKTYILRKISNKFSIIEKNAVELLNNKKKEIESKIIQQNETIIRIENKRFAIKKEEEKKALRELKEKQQKNRDKKIAKDMARKFKQIKIAEEKEKETLIAKEEEKRYKKIAQDKTRKLKLKNIAEEKEKRLFKERQKEIERIKHLKIKSQEVIEKEKARTERENLKIKAERIKRLDEYEQERTRQEFELNKIRLLREIEEKQLQREETKLLREREDRESINKGIANLQNSINKSK